MRIGLHSLGGFCRDIAGSAAVEFALTAPVLILLMFGIIEAGRALWAQNSLQYAVERAARCGVVYYTCNLSKQADPSFSGSCGVCVSNAAMKDYAVTQVYDQLISSSAFTITRPSATNLCVAGSWTFAPWFQSFKLPMVGNVVVMPPITLTSQSCRSE
jgi:hypothetical protein